MPASALNGTEVIVYDFKMRVHRGKPDSAELRIAAAMLARKVLKVPDTGTAGFRAAVLLVESAAGQQAAKVVLHHGIHTCGA